MTLTPLSEALTICVIMFSGACLAMLGGLRGWSSYALGFAYGAALYICIALIQALTPLPDTPALTLTLLVGTPILTGVWMCIRSRRLPGRDEVLRHARQLIVCLAITFSLLSLAFPFIDRMIYIRHVDSMQYLNIGALFASGTFEVGINHQQLQQRLLGFGMLHAEANLHGEFYLRLLNPMIALSVLSVMIWALVKMRRDDIPAWMLWIALTLMVLSLVSMNRFLMNSFYLNGHLLVALFMLVIATTGWLMAQTPGQVREHTAFFSIQAATAAALAVTRPEGFILAAIALAPTLFCGALPWRQRTLTLVALGAATAAWHGFVLYVQNTRGVELRMSVLGPCLAGILLMLSAPLLKFRFVTKHPLVWLLALEGALWGGLVILTFRDPQLLLDSIQATKTNIATFWSWSSVFAGFVFLLALLWAFPGRAFLRLPVTTYIPLCLVLAYLRDAPYREGGGDSFNRILISCVPLAILLIGAAATSDRWALPFIKDKSGNRKEARNRPPVKPGSLIRFDEQKDRHAG